MPHHYETDLVDEFARCRRTEHDRSPWPIGPPFDELGPPRRRYVAASGAPLHKLRWRQRRPAEGATIAVSVEHPARLTQLRWLVVSIVEQVAERDTALFAYVDGQTSDDDRRSLLAVHHAIAKRAGIFSYLEIGSHLGGTLQAFVADPRCRRIVSIDPRPASQPDDRGQIFAYEGNSSMRMLSLLADVPGADMDKLETIELSTEDIAPGSLARPDLCVVDGEHTHAAALRDARFCRSAMQGAGVILFHDRAVVARAILDFLRELSGPVTAYPLRDSFFAVELGAEAPLIANPEIVSQLGSPNPILWRVAGRLGMSVRLIMAAGYARRMRQRLT